eukprot:snap_masked-scaffold_6-processed-gene-15.45-mRNA-1 protein AED:1.00 eAED:1.00 QI:0/-1/0/0/-1/1/1/0/237
MEKDGFIVVSRRRGFKAKPSMGKRHNKDLVHAKTVGELDSEYSKLFEVFRGCLSNSVSNLLKKCKENDATTFKQIVVIGLGSVSKEFSTKSMLQFVFVSLLKEELKDCSCTLYDPVFNKTDETFLNKKGFKARKEKFTFKDKQTFSKIYFMPHCPGKLYKEVFTNLSKGSVIVGNDLNMYSLNFASNPNFLLYAQLKNNSLHQYEIFEQEVPHILRALKMKYQEAFSNTVLIYKILE